MDSATISVVEIRAWCMKTLDVVEKDGRSHFMIPKALYYMMDPTDIWTLPAVEPVVGDALDDVVTLREEVSLPLEELVAWHSLEHLSGLLSVIASQWNDDYPFLRHKEPAKAGDKT